MISWSQTEIDGLEDAPVAALSVGAAWSWRGDVVQVDGRSDVLKLDHALGSDRLRQGAYRSARRLIGGTAHPTSSYAQFEPEEPLPDNRFEVTDGAKKYTVTFIASGRGTPPLLAFRDSLPPRHAELWVVRQTVADVRPKANGPDATGVICFTQGSRIAVPGGAKAVEDLCVGDHVLTRDNGPRPIEWIGQRHMTGARLFAMPRLRPVRIRAGAFGVQRPDEELLVSPQHRLLLSGPVARDLFNTNEVLVAASDLIDGQSVCRDAHVPSVTYIHLMLPEHNVLWANGVACESFHPANTTLDSLAPEDRARLLRQSPEIAADPYSYGAFARRNLTASEAAIFMRAA